MVDRLLVDTVAVMVLLDRALDDRLFQGRAETVDLDTGERGLRLWSNPPDGEYGPRLTYWPQSWSLRVEWSLAKMDVRATERYLDRLGLCVNLERAQVQRIDYTADLDVASVPLYLKQVQSLSLRSWSRQVFPGQGVVWKGGSRWVKFYAKAKEGKLRFEVSSYRDSVRYMAGRWFGCERTLGEMVQPGRGLYVLAYYWDLLGLGRARASEVAELDGLRDAFGVRNVAAASHALRCVREHGTESYKSLNLISKSSFYRWKRELAEQGFLPESSRMTLRALHLPIEGVIGSQNLNNRSAPLGIEERKKMWANLAGTMGINPKTRPNFYLLERCIG